MDVKRRPKPLHDMSTCLPAGVGRQEGPQDVPVLPTGAGGGAKDRKSVGFRKHISVEELAVVSRNCVVF